jgi:hypothetical protein
MCCHCAAYQSIVYTEITTSCDRSLTESDILTIHPVANMQVFITEPGDIHSKTLRFQIG